MGAGAGGLIRKRVAALEKRADHLAKRIAASDKDLTYDRQELGVLLWAIRHLRPMFADALRPRATEPVEGDAP